MVTVLKWAAVSLLAGLVFLIAKITDEYFRPYKRKP
jgi:hypothetical protein